MSFIRLPNIEPVPVSEEEGAIIRRYFQSLDHAKGARKLPFFSVAVCGSSGVGKKALLERHFYGIFPRQEMPYDPTQPTPYLRQIMINDRPCYIRWDLVSIPSHSGAPSTGPDSLGQVVRDSNACLFVYDMSNRPSFETLSKFHEAVQAELSTLQPTSPSADTDCKRKPILVVANKIDLPPANWAIAKSEGRDFAARIGATYLETSAKADLKVSEMAAKAMSCGLIHRAEAALEDHREAEAREDEFKNM